MNAGQGQVLQLSAPVVVTQPPVYSRPPLREWSTGIFGCFEDMPSCCLGFWCGTIGYPCYLSNKLGESCCLPICVCGSTWLIALRVKLRTEHNIMGDIMDDSSKASWCYHCTMCQLSREHDHIQALQALQT
ncbi:cornifelin homolog B-like [Ostrea edulis]|uniref:cornifelin homolog B-like n=1 Tax=Ostrea edulis TaxID=37623 RepID=UPI0024AFE7AF|nr:cornifelin homolog B-like [Ostrea edulis]